MIADGLSAVGVTVTLRDALGNPVPGQTVVLSVSGAGNTITQTKYTDKRGGPNKRPLPYDRR